MGNRFHEEKYAKSHSPKRWFGNPKPFYKRYFNRVDRRKLNRELDKEDPDIPQRWSPRNWGLWKWF